MQRMYFYNTDVSALGGESRVAVLYEEQVAVTGGDLRKFGYQLEKLVPGDLLVMYENGVGVLGVGEVKEEWNKKVYKRPIYYKTTETEAEYRIAVDWIYDLREEPISLDRLREHVGSNFTPRGATQLIRKNRDAIQKCIEDAIGEGLPAPKGADVESGDKIPGRKDVTISRIVRDSRIARKVKLLNGYKCQLCSVVLKYPDGQLYAEAHHIRPLGGEHKGADSMENVICVCPNCHAKLDLGMIELRWNKITHRSDEHRISMESIEYHNEVVFRG